MDKWEEKYPGLDEYWRTLYPTRRAIVATCACGEGLRSPFTPSPEDPGYEPYPRAPQALVDWCVAHQSMHAYDVLQRGERPHRILVAETIWTEMYDSVYRWGGTDWLPVVWQVDAGLTVYEREHPPQTLSYRAWRRLRESGEQERAQIAQ